MKQLLTVIGLLFLALQLNAQLVDGAEITFTKEIHDFGKLEQHGDASVDFKFTNTGNAPLIISKSEGTCGCTVPDWPRRPIKPGETASIKVKYDSKRVGPFNKTVKVFSNASNAPTQMIRIKGNILSVNQAENSPEKKKALPQVVAK